MRKKLKITLSVPRFFKRFAFVLLSSYFQRFFPSITACFAFYLSLEPSRSSGVAATVTMTSRFFCSVVVFFSFFLFFFSTILPRATLAHVAFIKNVFALISEFFWPVL
jgi:hypothetical protein